MGFEESQRLADLVVSKLHEDESMIEAMTNSLLDEYQHPDKWLLLEVDWKATEEIEWQANKLLAIADVTETWNCKDFLSMIAPVCNR